MKISILDGTTELPLSTIGVRAGICWDSPTHSTDKNVARAKDCIKSGHGRVMEYVDIEFVIEGASARMMRELYTHIGGSPTRLQSSTRYVDCEHFEYMIPPFISNLGESTSSDKEVAAMEYHKIMDNIKDTYKKLSSLGMPREDVANVLPLGMNSKMIMKCNLRMLVNLMNMRLCTRAYHEIRKFAIELKELLSKKNDEWKWVSDSLFVPKCEQYKYLNDRFTFCTESKCCGRHKKIADIDVVS